MSKKIRVAQLPQNVDEAALLGLCASFGEISDFSLVPGSSTSHSSSRNTTRDGTTSMAATVTFEDPDDASDAVANLNGYSFSSCILRVTLLPG